MRSEIWKPLLLRSSCTRRTTSRASPSRTSSGVRSVTSAATNPPSAATAKPLRACRRTSTSAGSSSRAMPSTCSASDCPDSSVRAAVAASIAANAVRTAGSRLPYFCPSSRGSACSSYATASKSELSKRTCFTFSSSASSAPWRAITPAASAPAQNAASGSGWRTFNLLRWRALCPRDTSLCTICMSWFSAGSMRAPAAAGQSVRCTDSGWLAPARLR